jgi:SEC-C motif
LRRHDASRARSEPAPPIHVILGNLFRILIGGVACSPILPTNRPFEPLSKRRRGYPSERHVKAGVQIVHGDKRLEEKLGRNDLCPCGSGRRFKRCCLTRGRF